ncbi:hypothetical protein [Polaribacter glomeratus]|nr:hypothetical protein [Polaribacter glomeratus]TXD63731.1 hypothetical protein ESX12_17135 [Polaribacter glomeratus]
MKKEKAIKILTQQSEKLKNIDLSDIRNWDVETKTYLSDFFGKESHQYNHFRMNLTDPRISVQKEKIILFLNDCCNIISNIGLYKPLTENWFSKLPNWIINLGLPALCFISFGTGILFTNNNNYELRKENSELKEKLSLISSDTITNNHKNLSNNPK